MKHLSSKEIRAKFVSYFERNGHTAVASSSIIPENDATLLFANAGMNQFKNAFLGLEKRPYVRAVSVQKCLRAGGKHNDLDNVGFTARHHTFFEMLGNFSFGDYFKKDAIRFAWELLTKDLGIPKEKLYVTVFEKDDEAAQIWHEQEGVPKDRIFRLGEKDNFWRMGDVGPCGPCSEIFYDHGPKAGRESDPFKGIVAGEDRFVEIWNLVFMQFDEQAGGKLVPLPKPSVDTGSGLERVCAALQGKFSNYDTDLFMPLIEKAASIGGWDLKKLYAAEDKYRDDKLTRETAPKDLVKQLDDLAALRVVADHVRSTSLVIADGGMPSNEGRGYVIRRIIRRGLRFGRKISETKSIIPAVSEVFIREMGSVYPELEKRKDHILAVLKDEESRFLATLDQGTSILNAELDALAKSGKKVLPGEVVFKLYDTYGFPVDLTQIMVAERGVTVDEKAFDLEVEKARTKAKASWKGKAMNADEQHLVKVANEQKNAGGETEFVGYDHLSADSKILYISNGTDGVAELGAGATGYIVTKSTPLYGEGGGQVGDQGTITNGKAKAEIFNVTKKEGIFFHHVNIVEGTFKTGDSVKLEVGLSERRKTASNHSATHLLHSALRQVLGTSVTQAGSLVDAEKLRFDFTSNQPMTAQQIEKVEQLVNDEIAKAVTVEPKVMDIDSAMKSGALALFGEKYGKEVRVLRMGEFSTELCGGTHVSNTSQIRLFKIVSETGVSSGVRRIEALTGDGALQYLLKHTHENMRAREAAGLQETWVNFLDSKREVVQWIEDSKDAVKKLEKDVRGLKAKQVSVDDLLRSAVAIPGGKLVLADLEVEDRDVLAQLSDQLKDKVGSGVVILVGKGGGTHPVLVSVSKDLAGKYSAGNLLKEVAATMGGKGGGRPDFAQGAVPQREKIADGFAAARKLLGVLS